MLKRLNKIPLLLLTVVSITMYSSSAPGQSTDMKLRSVVREMIDAQISYNTAALDKLYASDYVEISPVGDIDSREKAIGFYSPEATPNRDKIKRVVEADEFMVRDYGKLALVVARVTASRTVEGQPPRPPVSFRTTFVFRKEKEWKITSVQYTGMRLPLTQPAK